MSEIGMDVFLLNTPQAGIERAALVRNLAETFKKDVPSIEKMLRKPRTLIKSNIAPELAAKYKALIEKAGGQCELHEFGKPPEPELTLDDIPQNLPQKKPLSLEPVVATADRIPGTEEAPADAACYCVKCGSVIRAGQTKCPKCFTPVTEFVSKDKVTAGLLAFFVGGLGIHRFYLGQWWGIFYLLFWGTLIPSIVSIIEAIVFWSTSKERWDEKYGRMSKSSGSMVGVLIGGIFLLIFVTGILAAIALPAYQDYTTRAKITAGMPLVTESQQKVVAFIKKTQSYPDDNILVGISDEVSSDVIEHIRVIEGGKLEVTYKIPALKDNNTIIWSVAEKGRDFLWSCGEGSVQNKYRPTACRSQDASPSSTTSKSTSKTALTKKISSSDKSVSINVPESWISNSKLVDTALVGASNAIDETYAIVLAEPKADFETGTTVNDVSEKVQKQFMTNLQGQMQGAPHDLNIAGKPAQQFIMLGVADGIKVAYVVTIIETDTQFYRVLAWTLQSRLEKHRALLESVSGTVKVN